MYAILGDFAHSENPSGLEVYLNAKYQVKMSNGGGGFIGSAGLRYTF
jgi:hypothetical protein